MTILKIGSSGLHVKDVQRRLHALYPELDVDGEYGVKTETLVKVFQLDNYLDVDGEVGPETFEALRAATDTLIGPPQSPPPTPLRDAFANAIVTELRSKVGKREKPNNSGFVDGVFEKFMRAFGWFTGAAWCMFLQRAVWLTVYANYPRTCAAIRSTLNGSCMSSWNNARKPGSGFHTGSTPERGAIGIYNHGGGKGHAVGVEVAYNGPHFDTIEGNSNSRGGREGIEVSRFRGKRSTRDKGFVGFIYPPNPADFGDAV